MTMPGSVRSERSRDMLNARHATRHRIGTAPALPRAPVKAGAQSPKRSPSPRLVTRATAQILALLALLLLSLAAPVSAAPSPSPDYQSRARQLLRLLAAPGDESDFFAPLFLDAVPVDRWRAIAADLRAQHGKPLALGAVRRESATAGQVEIRYERATVGFTLVVAPQPPARVIGLRIVGARTADDSLDKVMADLVALPGTSALSIARLTDAGPQPIRAHRADAQMATGSSFKLYILAELARAVAAGDRRWSDVVPLGPKSFSGRLMRWPDAAPMTLHSLATAMIAESDNSAADTLLLALGRHRVDAMVAASGSTHRFGPTVVYRDKRTPPELAKIFSQIFLGTRLECARCHNHPNEKWTLTDFHAFSAFFGRIKRKGAGVSPPISGGTEWFFHGGSGNVTHPVTGKTLAPKPPDAPQPKLDAKDDPRDVLVDWMANPDNPFFARAMVNRVWGAFFGRGIVEPVDDMRTSNPPVNAALLDALAKHFADSKYDQKSLIRTIMKSRLYQLSSVPNDTNAADRRNFSRSYRRRLSAEVLLDAVSDVTGVPESFSATWPGARAMETWTYKIGSEFLDAFGRPNSSSDPPCERNAKGTIVQSLHMMHAEKLNSKIIHEKGLARQLADGKQTPAEIAQTIYLAALSRRPTEKENAVVASYFQKHKDNRRAAVEDFLWALINSAEFVLNH